MQPIGCIVEMAMKRKKTGESVGELIDVEVASRAQRVD